MEKAELQQMIERVRMINRTHAALRSSLNLEDIYPIVQTTMISQSGLDLSRVMLFEYDRSRAMFRGLSSLGASNRKAHERICQEIEEEEQALAAMVRNLHDFHAIDEEERAIFSSSINDLTSHSFWITAYQKFNNDNTLLEKIRRIEMICNEPDNETSSAALSFLESVVRRPTAFMITKAELERVDVPESLKKLLPSDSIWSAIRTQKGVRLLLVADKIYHDHPLGEIDLLHMDWFSSQVSLSLENAEMYQEMEQAYNSLREIDHMKSNFLATISHELRTPLTAINGYMQLLLGNRVGPLSPGQKEVLERILNHSNQLTGKVNDLIEIAELDSGQTIELPLEPIDPLHILMTVLPRVEQRRAHKGITIEPMVEAPIPQIVSNPDALERIFFHLLDNAVKFGNTNGYVRIEFLENDGELTVKISDNGIGITEDQKQRIFDAFYQVDNQLTRSYEGMGIGLAIIKKQLEISGGRIEVESQTGRGSVFSVIYPCATI
jgi:signal transduction histidine kinase